MREWHVTADDVAGRCSRHASDDLALTQEFSSELSHGVHAMGDVLYLPPGVAHWGTAHRACLTYSIGMRAPQMSDLAEATLPDAERSRIRSTTDPDLELGETRPGYISRDSRRPGIAHYTAMPDPDCAADRGRRSGRFATETKALDHTRVARTNLS